MESLSNKMHIYFKRNYEKNIDTFLTPTLLVSVFIWIALYFNSFEIVLILYSIFVSFVLIKTFIYFNQLKMYGRRSKEYKRNPCRNITSKQIEKWEPKIKNSLNSVFYFSKYYTREDYLATLIVRCHKFNKHDMTKYLNSIIILPELKNEIIDTIDKENASLFPAINSYDHVLFWNKSGSRIIFSKTNQDSVQIYTEPLISIEF